MVRRSRRAAGQAPDTSQQNSPDRMMKQYNAWQKLRKAELRANREHDAAAAAAAAADAAAGNAAEGGPEEPQEEPAEDANPEHTNPAPELVDHPASQGSPDPGPGNSEANDDTAGYQSTNQGTTSQEPATPTNYGDSSNGQAAATSANAEQGASSTIPAMSQDLSSSAAAQSSQTGSKRGSQNTQEVEETDAKRQKTGGNAEGKKRATEAGVWVKPDMPEVEDACEQLSNNLAAIRGNDPKFNGPVVFESDMSQDVAYQALASVIEAINRNQGHPIFSLFHPQAASDNPHLDEYDEHPILHRTHEALIPYHRQSGGNGHLSLLSIRRGSPNYILDHYDSSTPMKNRYSGTVAKQYVIDALWAEPIVDPNSDVLRVGANVNNVRTQVGNWACGLHTILNGWAIAMGLRLNKSEVGRARMTDLYAAASEVVNLAIRGRMDDKTILSLLRCYQWIEEESHILPGREFDLTMAFPTENALSDYVTRLADEERIALATQLSFIAHGPSGAPQGVQGPGAGPSISAAERRLLNSLKDGETKLAARTDEQAENDQYDATSLGDGTSAVDDSLAKQIEEELANEAADDATQADTTTNNTALDYGDGDQTLAQTDRPSFGSRDSTGLMRLPGLGGFGGTTRPSALSSTQPRPTPATAPVSAAAQSFLTTADTTAGTIDGEHGSLFDPNGQFSSSPAPPVTPAPQTQSQGAGLTNNGGYSTTNSLFDANAPFTSPAVRPTIFQQQQQQSDQGDSGGTSSTDSLFGEDLPQGTPDPYPTGAQAVQAATEDETDHYSTVDSVDEETFVEEETHFPANLDESQLDFGTGEEM